MTKPISMDKQYKTRDGRNVRILCVDREDSSFPVVALVSGSKGGQGVDCYTSCGKYGDDETSSCDLIEVSQWDFPIDTPVLVRNHVKNDWREFHFAGVDKNGDPTTFDNGLTSWTLLLPNEVSSWKYCKVGV